jgi:hypothetical protein
MSMLLAPAAIKGAKKKPAPSKDGVEEKSKEGE